MGVPVSDGVQLKDFDFGGLFRALGIAAVPHSFHSSFRDWVAECTDAPHAVMEAAHVRSDLFERRRVLMEQWAEFLANGNQER